MVPLAHPGPQRRPSSTVMIQFGDELLSRLRAAAGPKGIARLVRAAVERELARIEAGLSAGEH